MVREKGLLAPLLVVLFCLTSGVRGEGTGSCVVRAEHGESWMLAVQMNVNCDEYRQGVESLESIVEVTYRPPDSTHNGPARLIPVEAGHQIFSELRSMEERVTNSEPQVIRKMIGHGNKEQAASWLRETLKIQCTLLFDSPNTVGKSGSFLIMDLSIGCSRFLTEEMYTPTLSEMQFMRSITFDAGRNSVRQDSDVYRVFGSLDNLQMKRDAVSVGGVSYLTLPTSGLVQELFKEEQSRAKKLQRRSSSVAGGKSLVSSDATALFNPYSVRTTEDFRVVFSIFNFSKSHQLVLQAAAVFGLEVAFSGEYGSQEEAVAEIFKTTPTKIKFAMVDVVSDPTWENPRLLTMDPTKTTELWRQIGECANEKKRFRVKQVGTSSVGISLVFLEDSSGGRAWVSSNLDHLTAAPGPYEPENEKSGSRKNAPASLSRTQIQLQQQQRRRSKSTANSKAAT